MFNYPFLLPDFRYTEIDTKPPKLYRLMQSLVNYDNDNPVKIEDLAKACAPKIFDFYYPLSQNVVKEDFEEMILNNFIMYRIGFDTYTLFKIQLKTLLNSIMPKYNMMFDSISNWNLFKTGRTVTKNGNDNRVINSNNTITKEDTAESTGKDVIDKDVTTTSENTTNTTNNSTTESSNISKQKISELPQSQLQNLEDNSYVNNYQVTNDTTNSTDESTGNATSNSSSSENENSSVTKTNTNTYNSSETNTSNSNDKNNYEETISYTQENLLELYTVFQNQVQSIYNMIFKDLEQLFFGLVD